MSGTNYQFYLFYLFLVLHISAGAQTYNFNKDIIYCQPQKPNFKLKLTNYSSVHTINEQLKQQFHKHGYLGYSMDSILHNNDSSFYFIYTGTPYKLKNINIDHAAFSYLSKHFVFKKNINPKLISKTNAKIHSELLNSGYPYSTISSEYIINKKNVVLDYKIHLGQLVTFDSIVAIPSDLISSTFLTKKTGIKGGKPYNEKLVLNIKNNLAQTKLLDVDTVINVINGNSASNIIKVKPIKQNTFNALIGLQNNRNNKNEFTGSATIHLINTIKQGEKIAINWQKPESLSQLLELEFKFPYVWKLPLGTSIYLNIDKKDTSYTNTVLKSGISTSNSIIGEITLFGKWTSSTINNNSEFALVSSNTNQYGLGYNYSKFDNPFLPKKGFEFNTELFAGNHKQYKNDTSKSIQPILELIAEFSLAIQLPIGSVFFRNKCGLLYSDSLKSNNLYRIGGVNSMRGYNENSIYAKQYNIAKTEYRLPLGSHSYIYLLYDIGYLNTPNNNSFSFDTKQAIGAGMNIKTTAGYLSISYALGQNYNHSFLLNEGKIHIGYQNRF